MKKFLGLKSGLVALGSLLICLVGKPAKEQTSTDTARILNAANAFLGTLDAKQQSQVVYAWNDVNQRQRWSNFPTGVVPRGGISLKDMSEPQRGAAMQLLSVVLSPMGLEKVNAIRMADDDFKQNGSRHHRPGGGPGPNGSPGSGSPGNGPSPGSGPPPPRPPFGIASAGGGPFGRNGDLFGKDLYYISFLGRPSDTSPWMLQFGGHHLALNIAFDGNQNVITPTLTGAQPALFQANGRTIRPLGRESDKALALLKSLENKQRGLANLPYRVPDLILGPGQDGKKIAPEGLQASAMSEAQRSLLLDVISEWAGMVNESAASTRMRQLKADLDNTWFAWSGPMNFESGSNVTAYYRITGPHLVIEYAPQNDEPANHVHTIYRDPTNDYGGVSATAR